MDGYNYVSEGESSYEEYSEDDYFASDNFQDSLDPAVCAVYSKAKVVTEQSLLAAQKKDLHRVMEMISLEERHARALLIHFRWDVEKVVGVLVEYGKERLCAQAGIKIAEHSSPCSSLSWSTAMCEVCMEKVPENMVTAMDCGHYFCNDCWTEHFFVKIKEGQSRNIRCMAHRCNIICDENKIRNLVCEKDPSLSEKFDRFLLESYVEDNRRGKWCPSVPHCGNAIFVEDNELCEVECACGLQFCFGCSSEAHSPCSCLMWELWSKKGRAESENVTWISEHTKPCPKCSKMVEKNGGCNHVLCVCGQSFCWLCGGATGKEHSWTSIAGHTCGRFVEDKKVKAEREKRDLFRYIHYYTRFKAHIDSLKLESNLEESTRNKITMLEDRDSKYRDFSWVTNGLWRLFRSRRILSYSYPFAYFMFGPDLFRGEITEEEKELKKDLFEDQQQQLEATVERLSKFLEEPFHDYNAEKIQALKMKILDLSAIVDKFCAKLYEHIENDLLGSIQNSTHKIAPYQPRGIQKALNSDHLER